MSEQGLPGCDASSRKASMTKAQCAWEAKELSQEQRQAGPESCGKGSGLDSKSNGEPQRVLRSSIR